ncbi:MAG: hypothetical protein V1493_02730 [Candidatus Diapherotrites archaeon]
MASKNSVLLVLKQNSGIKYHDLLAKIVGEYSNINSSRAALSRLVKNLEVLGLVCRRNEQLFLTDKGLLKIQAEMKNKLLLKIEEIVKEADHRNPEQLVKQLSVLVERAKQEQDLQSIAKSSLSFPVSRIEKIGIRAEEHSRHLAYLSRVISKDVRALRAMDFKDSLELNAGEKKSRRIILGISKKISADFLVQCNDPEKMRQLKESFGGGAQGESVVFPVAGFEKTASFLLGCKTKAVIVAGDLRIDLEPEKAVITGPAKKIIEIQR